MKVRELVTMLQDVKDQDAEITMQDNGSMFIASIVTTTTQSATSSNTSTTMTKVVINSQHSTTSYR